MGTNNDLACPVSGCPFDGTVSQVIHHISTREDAAHIWETLGYQNSWHFRNTHTEESNSTPTDTASNDAEISRIEPQASTVPLDGVPGIGETRAEALRTAGFERAADVADASIRELSRTSKVTETTARCIRAAAQEECGWEHTVISEIADAANADRTEVAAAYADLAAALVPPQSG